MISVLIVDDDLAKISSIISCIQETKITQFEFKQASCVQEAIEILKVEQIHLLISDILMPIRSNEIPDERGGEALLKEIYKTRNNVNVPLYIVAFTQYEHVIKNFQSVWKVWKFDTESIDWRYKLRDLIFHISLIKGRIVKEKVETIFVEGYIDKQIIECAIDLFYPGNRQAVNIEATSYNGGSSWVERQLIIWAKSLYRKDDNYLQALGVFDYDKAGNNSIKSLRHNIIPDSAEQSTFSHLSWGPKYATHLQPAYQKGILLPVTIEEMLSLNCWKHAENKGWLTSRIIVDDVLQDPKRWDRMTQTIPQFLDTLGLSPDIRIYVDYKIKEDNKLNLLGYLKGLDAKEMMEALAAFKPFLSDAFSKLGFNNLSSNK